MEPGTQLQVLSQPLENLLFMQGVFQSSFAVRPLSIAAGASRAEEGSGSERSSGRQDGKSALAAQGEADDAIMDQIPQRPMGVVEGTSYTVVIIAAIAMAGNGSLAPYYSCSSCYRNRQPMQCMSGFSNCSVVHSVTGLEPTALNLCTRCCSAHLSVIPHRLFSIHATASLTQHH